MATIHGSRNQSSRAIKVIHEAIPDNYRGVTCFRCGEPIPVSAKLAGPWGERNCEEANATYSFPLRCRVCEEEGVYSVSVEIPMQSK